MFEVPGFRGVVTEDGKRFLADDHAGFKAGLAQFAGQEVYVMIAPPRRPPSQALRGYYYAALVDLVIKEDGHATVDEAHAAIVRGVLAPAWAKARPSTSDEAMSREEFAEFVERACAHFILDRGWVVPEPSGGPR